MNADQADPTPTPPAGFRVVTKDEFSQALAADKRDIMPSHERPDSTDWLVVATRKVWGWTTPGWRYPGRVKVYALAP